MLLLPRDDDDGMTRVGDVEFSRLLLFKILEFDKLNFLVRLVMVRRRELDNTESPPP